MKDGQTFASAAAVEWTVDGMETQNAAAVNLHSATGNAYNVAGWGWARAVGTILGDHGRHDAHQLQLVSHRPLSLARKKSGGSGFERREASLMKEGHLFCISCCCSVNARVAVK